MVRLFQVGIWTYSSAVSYKVDRDIALKGRNRTAQGNALGEKGFDTKE